LIYGLGGKAIFVIGGFFDNLAFFIPFAVVGASFVILGINIQVRGKRLEGIFWAALLVESDR